MLNFFRCSTRKNQCFENKIVIILGISDGIFFISQDFDQPVADYVIDTLGNESVIEITEYSPTLKYVKGKFQLHMYKTSGSYGWNPMPPNYLNITEGAFYFHLDY